MSNESPVIISSSPSQSHNDTSDEVSSAEFDDETQLTPEEFQQRKVLRKLETIYEKIWNLMSQFQDSQEEFDKVWDSCESKPQTNDFRIDVNDVVERRRDLNIELKEYLENRSEFYDYR